jgi:hypothetical protein
MPQFQMKVKTRVQRIQAEEGLSVEEIAWALREVERICQLEWPNADYSVSPIDCTDGQWHRQKPERATFRTIISIHRDTREIIVQAILRRDSNTYQRVELIFDQTKDK